MSMQTPYRADIDGLRALAVLPVIAFHSGIPFLQGGYVGVDVFFVISGFLIGGIVQSEISGGIFSLTKFYMRRIVRLGPALIAMLTLTLISTSLLYDPRDFDGFGKELFFSSLGLSNLHYGMGTDYFQPKAFISPLIHTWSLGVEEQFYFLWPITALVIMRVCGNALLPFIFLLILISLAFSNYLIAIDSSWSYFSPFSRAFELFIGVFYAILCARRSSENAQILGRLSRELVAVLCILTIFTCFFVFDNATRFPGWLALIPCVATLGLLATSNSVVAKKVLSNRLLVGVGLISYPMYLVHQPTIAIFDYLNIKLSTYYIFICVLGFSGGLSYVIYRYMEKPAARWHRNSLASNDGFVITKPAMALFFVLLAVATCGLLIAKLNGIPQRIAYLNPYAAGVVTSYESNFHERYTRGLHNFGGVHRAQVLFVGDSMVQGYVVPFEEAFNISRDHISVVSRGGCVLLKGTTYKDVFADISCDELRTTLYSSQISPRLVVISQLWGGYLIDSGSDANYEKSTLFIEPLINTIKHFKDVGARVMIIGKHPQLSDALFEKPLISLNSSTYESLLREVEIVNFEEMGLSQSWLDSVADNYGAYVVHPVDWFCQADCILSDGSISFFSDPSHLSKTGERYITDVLLQDRMTIEFVEMSLGSESMSP